MAFGIYIHVPFCRKRCPYCDFAFVVRARPPLRRYEQLVIRELAMHAPPPCDTVYLGGGTPSMLAPDSIGRILAAVPRKPQAVVSLEANPEDVGLFAVLPGLGVNRLSLGIQSLSDRSLAVLGRNHDAAAARGALEAALAAGFDSVSADLIFGVPGQRTADFLADARALVDAGVQHISAYGLTVHEGTLLAKDALRGRFNPVSDEIERRQFLALHDLLTDAGYEHYEISNYAVPGHRSIHNELYWTEAPYAGVGPSAHSFDPAAGRRWWNLRSLDRWMEAIDAGRLPVADEETLDVEARRVESLYLALRRKEGIAQDSPLLQGARAAAKVEALLAAELLRVVDGRYILAPEGMAVADTVVESLLH